MATTSRDLAAVDGRTARRDRNRAAVLDAVLELFAEGTLFPSAEAVAERSGVSLRSVYRYVEDTDDLVRAAVERHRANVAPLFEVEDLGEGTLEGRIDRLVHARVNAYEAVATTARASRARAYTNEIIRRQLEEASALLADQVAAQFAPELRMLAPAKRRAVLAACDALVSLETIELYRYVRCRTTQETTAYLAEALARLLEPSR